MAGVHFFEWNLCRLYLKLSRCTRAPKSVYNRNVFIIWGVHSKCTKCTPEAPAVHKVHSGHFDHRGRHLHTSEAIYAKYGGCTPCTAHIIFNEKRSRLYILYSTHTFQWKNGVFDHVTFQNGVLGRGLAGCTRCTARILFNGKMAFLTM